MRGSRALSCSLSLLISWASFAFAENPELKALEAKQQSLQSILHKIQKGSDPCFTDSCQAKKFQLINKIYQTSDSIPLNTMFLSQRNEGIQSAYDLIRKKFEPTKNIFPRTAKEWIAYWNRRRAHETELRSSWMSFLSQIYSLNDGLQIFMKSARSSDENQSLIQELWARGLPRIAELIMSSAILIDAAVSLERQGQPDEGQKLRRQALQASEERIKLEEPFKGQLEALLQNLFPGASFKQIISFVNLVQKWADQRTLFDADFVDQMTSHSSDIQSLTRLAQDFTDLEYGFVGLSNFYSIANPHVRAESELAVQEFLDQVEDRARTIIELSSSYFLLKSGRVFFDSRILQNIALPTTYNILSIQKSWSISTSILPPATRTAELSSSLNTFDEQMEKRNEELLKTLKILKQKLSETDFQIAILKQTEETHDN